jgi:hypothetical protein
MMATPLQDAAAKVAAAARHAQRNPADPAAALHLNAAIEHLAAVRTTHAIGDAISGRRLAPDAQRRILVAVAAGLGPGAAA